MIVFYILSIAYSRISSISFFPTSEHLGELLRELCTNLINFVQICRESIHYSTAWSCVKKPENEFKINLKNEGARELGWVGKSVG